MSDLPESVAMDASMFQFLCMSMFSWLRPAVDGIANKIPRRLEFAAWKMLPQGGLGSDAHARYGRPPASKARPGGSAAKLSTRAGNSGGRTESGFHLNKN